MDNQTQLNMTVKRKLDSNIKNVHLSLATMHDNIDKIEESSLSSRN